VIVTIHFKMFPLGTVRKLHARRPCSYGVLRKIVSITHELDISWNPDISMIFSGENLTLSDASVFLYLPSTAADSSQRSVLPPPS